MLAPARQSRLRSLVAYAPLGAAITVLAACGGKVVVDADGPAGTIATVGAGGAASAGPATVAATTGGGIVVGATSGAGGASCDGLLGDLQSKLDAAQACNPALEVVQCTGSKTVIDTCGCVAVANASPDYLAQAANSYAAWVSAGCGPFLCDHCPPPPQAKWFCSSATSKCTPAYEK